MNINEFYKKMNWFVIMNGQPNHIKSEQQYTTMIRAFFEELNKYLKSAEDWEIAFERAKKSSYGFPSVPHFLSKDERYKDIEPKTKIDRMYDEIYAKDAL